MKEGVESNDRTGETGAIPALCFIVGVGVGVGVRDK